MKRKNVGLFVSNLKDSFDHAVFRGACVGCEEADVNLFVFPGRYLKGQYADPERTRTDYQYNTVFAYARKQNIDVLLVLSGTIGTVISEEEKRTFLRDFEGIPIVLVADRLDGYPAIGFDNKSGLRKGIEDLVEKKGCKKIGMVSGPLTNEDALERLEVYREVLKAHNMETPDSLVVYGNFSEFCEEQVRDLLDRNPDLDAVVFANDQMALGGYEVFRERGLIVGRDIMVLGFDDSPAAGHISPGLSSVRADAEELGRLSVHFALKHMEQRSIDVETVGTTLVSRESTGNVVSGAADPAAVEALGQQWKNDPEKTVHGLMEYHFHKEMETFAGATFLSASRAYVTDFLACLFDGRKPDEEKSAYLCDSVITDMVKRGADTRLIYTLIDRLRDIILAKDPDGILKDHLYRSVMQLGLSLAHVKQQHDEDADFVQWMSNSIARDMLSYGPHNDKTYWSVCDKLVRLGFSAAFLYSLEEPFVNQEAQVWHSYKVPEEFLLKSYFNDPKDILLVPEDRQKVSGNELFNNSFMERNRRYTMILSLIHINDEQLGYLLCELAQNRVKDLPAITAQLCAAMKIMRMINEQQKSQTEDADENGVRASILDELTGVYNRRGFREFAEALICDPIHMGQMAILVYADLDNIKQINERLGHSEGDFALRSAANILTDSLRGTDVVARIGGDEFMALALVRDGTKGSQLKSRIRSVIEQFNENSQKDYYIELSVCCVELICEESVNLDHYMDMADEKLVEEKKKKRKEVFR